MKVGFQCPDNGIPIIGEWDEETGVLTFDLEDELRDAEYCPQEEIEEAQKWCDRYGRLIFKTDDKANEYLRSLHVDERLGTW